MPIHRIDLPHIDTALSNQQQIGSPTSHHGSASHSENSLHQYHNNIHDSPTYSHSRSHSNQFHSLIDSTLSLNIHSNANSNANLNQLNLNSKNSNSNSFSSVNMLKNSANQSLASSASHVNLKSVSSSASHLNLKSVSSLHSILSNLTATTEYSKEMLDNECGDLLKIADLDVPPENYDENNETDKGDVISVNFDAEGVDSTQIYHNRNTNFDLSSTDSEYESDSEFDVHHLDQDDILRSSTQPLKRCETTSSMCGNNVHSPTVELSESSTFDDDSLWDYKEKWAFVLIGLPACGKSTLVKDLIDFVRTQTNHKVRISSYNAGEIRREYENKTNNKFNFDDLESSQQLRDFYAFESLKQLSDDLINDKIDIGILDATNTTIQRRRAVFDRLNENSKNSNVIINPLLFEIKCSNRALRRFNIEQKSNNKDYIEMNKNIAIDDFFHRIFNYEQSYEKVSIKEINELNVKYFGIDNVGDTIYYDCGLEHHSSTRHQCLSFKSIALNLLYQFLIHYRVLYATDYLSSVSQFYAEGNYRPIKTIFSKPVTDDEIKSFTSIKTKEIRSVVNQDIKEENFISPSHVELNTELKA